LYRGTTENDVGFRLTRVAGVAPNEWPGAPWCCRTESDSEGRAGLV